MIFFPRIENWRMPESVIMNSFKEMSVDGEVGNEGIVLWFGHRQNGRAEITHLVFLRGKGVIKQPDLLIIESSLLNDVTDVAIELGVALIGQIHSHGEGYGIDLSYSDRRYGITVPYYLSIVAPDYAMRPNTLLSDCGVHVFEPSSGYRRLALDEINRRIHVVSGSELPIIKVGGEDS